MNLPSRKNKNQRKEKMSKHIFCQEIKKTAEHKGEDNTNCSWNFPQRLEVEVKVEVEELETSGSMETKQIFCDRLEYTEKSLETVETCCHSDSGENLAGVK